MVVNNVIKVKFDPRLTIFTRGNPVKTSMHYETEQVHFQEFTGYRYSSVQPHS